MQSRIVFIVLCVCTALFSVAQNPGYMGKKNVVGYGISISPFGISSGIKSVISDIKQKKFSPVIIHEGYMERSLNARLSLGLLGKYFTTTYNNEMKVSEFDKKPEHYYTIRNLSTAVYIKYYSSPYIAPWGKYYIAAPVLNFVRTSYSPYMYVRGNTAIGSDTLYMNFGPTQQKFTNFDLMLGKGRSSIIKDRICIDYGFNIYPVAIIRTVFMKSSDFLEDNYRQKIYIKRTASLKVSRVNMFYFHLRVGYLF